VEWKTFCGSRNPEDVLGLVTISTLLAEQRPKTTVKLLNFSLKNLL
jgi:hypothetical protein